MTIDLAGMRARLKGAKAFLDTTTGAINTPLADEAGARVAGFKFYTAGLEASEVLSGPTQAMADVRQSVSDHLALLDYVERPGEPVAWLFQCDGQEPIADTNQDLLSEANIALGWHREPLYRAAPVSAPAGKDEPSVSPLAEGEDAIGLSMGTEDELRRAKEALAKIAGQPNDAGEMIWTGTKWEAFRPYARQTLADLGGA